MIIPIIFCSSMSISELQALESSREKFEFQAEVSRLMDIIINSLYTKKEIFLRELISNGSDALDKIRFLSLGDESLLGETRDLEIRIWPLKGEHSLTIRDTGVGMTKQDLINNLGTVAKSGTAAFMEQIASGGDLSLIGQFGVGFYSIYLVADRVRVITKHNDDVQYVWESTADGTFTIAEDPRGNTLGRGTEITLYLKEDALEFLEFDTLKGLIKRYSEFITFPIHLRNVTFETIELEDDEDVPVVPETPVVDENGEEDVEIAADDADSEKKPAKRTTTRDIVTWHLINDQKPIWVRKPKDVTDEEHNAFFSTIAKVAPSEASKGGNVPNTWIHFSAEGEVEFKSILYVPSTAPADQYDSYYSKPATLRLYVRKVLISDEFADLLPRYLSFLKGLVDSDDLPLNVNRETLQQHKIIKVIAKKLTRKALEMLKKLADDEIRAKNEKEGKVANEEDDKVTVDDDDAPKSVSKEPLREGADSAYTKFWEVFSKHIKLGVIEDASNRSKLAKLLRFKTSVSDKVWRSLDEYVTSMKENQKQIYYIAGESLETLKKSPFLERFNALGLEVLLLTDPIDEYAMQNLPEFENYRIQSITKEGLQMPQENDLGKAKRREALYRDNFKIVTDFLKSLYGDKVEKVIVSQRLATAPVILSTSQYGYSANMERLAKAQAFADERTAFMFARKIMEINPRHPIITELKARLTELGDEVDVANTPEDLKDLSKLLFDTALLSSGFAMEDVSEFSGRMHRLMRSSLGLSSLDLEPEIEVPDVDPAAGVEGAEGVDTSNINFDEAEHLKVYGGEGKLEPVDFDEVPNEARHPNDREHEL
jgi:heat shock protein 90kDa beta